MSVVLDGVRTEVAAARAAVDSVETAVAEGFANVATDIAELAARLEDNPTAEEIAVIAAEAHEVASDAAAAAEAITAGTAGFGASLDALDPDVAGGPIVDDGAEEPVEEDPVE